MIVCRQVESIWEGPLLAQATPSAEDSFLAVPARSRAISKVRSGSSLREEVPSLDRNLAHSSRSAIDRNPVQRSRSSCQSVGVRPKQGVSALGGFGTLELGLGAGLTTE